MFLVLLFIATLQRIGMVCKFNNYPKDNGIISSNIALLLPNFPFITCFFHK